MSVWARHLDDLAAATAQLLVQGALQPQPLVDPIVAMVARDAVLVELRQLIGSVGDAPPFATVRELTLHDVVHRPAQALHQTLPELPRAVPFGTAELPAAEDKTLTSYERAWQQAARATIGLEAYVDGLGELPDAHAWLALRDLTDAAAALPYLDHDLSEAVLPRLKLGEDWALPYRMLTHPGHDALRVVSGEVRARVPAAEPPTSDARAPARGPQLVHPSSQALGQVPATGASSARGAGRDPLDRPARGSQVVGDLAEAMALNATERAQAAEQLRDRADEQTRRADAAAVSADGRAQAAERREEALRRDLEAQQNITTAAQRAAAVASQRAEDAEVRARELTQHLRDAEPESGGDSGSAKTAAPTRRGSRPRT